MYTSFALKAWTGPTLARDIAQRLTDARSCAIVLLDKREGEAKNELSRQVKLTKGASVGACSDSSAYFSGHAEGRKVAINKGIGGGTSNVPKLA